MENEARNEGRGDPAADTAALETELEQARREAEIHRQNSVLFRRLAMYEMAEIEGMAKREGPSG